MKNNIKQKAEYCLNCKIHNVGQDVHLEIIFQLLLKKVKEDNLEEAYKILCETTVMPAICGKNMSSSKTMSR